MPSEQEFLEVCAGVLGRSAVDQEASFYALGGDSLTALRLSMLVEEEWGISLELADITDAPSLAVVYATAAKVHSDR